MKYELLIRWCDGKLDYHIALKSELDWAVGCVTFAGGRILRVLEIVYACDLDLQ